jgi:tight adherence protein B
MGYLIALAFAAGFLFVFGLNLLYTELRTEREKVRRTQAREEMRSRQLERARLAVQHSDLHELAVTGAGELAHRSLRERVVLFIEQAGLRMRPAQIVVAGVLLAGLAAFVIGVPTGNPLFGVIGAVLCGGLPYLYVARLRRRRLDKLLSQLPDAFDLISRMMRAGQTFTQAMQVTASEADDPLSEEFGYCCDQQRLGLSADAALRDLARRTGVLEVRIFVLAVLVHRQTGGNLSDLLENLAVIIRERHRIKGIIAALTAEGRMQAYVLLALPILMLIGLTVFNREYVQELYDRPWLLCITGLAMLLGAFWMRRIVNFSY